MANKKFKGGTSSPSYSTPQNTPDAGNKPHVNNDELIAKPKEKKTFYKKMPELQRGKGTWGGGVSRP
ncbi:MAG: hypothetical protein ACXABY_31770 [Candidatus Thorarchaeota archaeon]